MVYVLGPCVSEALHLVRLGQREHHETHAPQARVSMQTLAGNCATDQSARKRKPLFAHACPGGGVSGLPQRWNIKQHKKTDRVCSNGMTARNVVACSSHRSQLSGSNNKVKNPARQSTPRLIVHSNHAALTRKGEGYRQTPSQGCSMRAENYDRRWWAR